VGGSAAEEAAKYSDDSGAVKMDLNTEEDEGDEELVVVNTMRHGSGGDSGSKAVADIESGGGGDSKATDRAVAKQRSGGLSPETDLRADEKGSPATAAALGGASRNNSDLGSAPAGDKWGADDGMRHATAQMSSMSLGGGATSPSAGTGKTLGALKPLGGGGGRMTALPHHVPKVEGLASKMEDIRRNMGEEVRTKTVVYVLMKRLRRLAANSANDIPNSGMTCCVLWLVLGASSAVGFEGQAAVQHRRREGQQEVAALELEVKTVFLFVHPLLVGCVSE
jgi:hypothetical protein